MHYYFCHKSFKRVCFGIPSLLLIYLSMLVPVSQCCNYYNFVQVYTPKKYQNQDSGEDISSLNQFTIWNLRKTKIWKDKGKKRRPYKQTLVLSRIPKINLPCLLSLLCRSLVTSDQFLSTLAIWGIQKYKNGHLRKTKSFIFSFQNFS